MIHVNASHLDDLTSATSPADARNRLSQALDLAIRFEHATIPPYLVALYSIMPGRNAKVAEVLHGIVCEEMLHLSLACNLYNAVSDDPPELNYPGFVPSYPGPLPGGVHGDLEVGLNALSIPLIRDTFMMIEEPDHPFRVDDLEPARGVPRAGLITIGQFYERIREAIRVLARTGVFARNHDRQLDGRHLQWRYGQDIFPVIDVDSANAAIDVILSQGEGSTDSPEDLDGELSHYYRFAEVVRGYELQRDAAGRWAYNGNTITLEPEGVYPIRPKLKSSDYALGSKERALNDHFNFTYTKLLALLERCFAGEPGYFRQAFGLMATLRLQAHELIQHPLGDGYHAGPTFEYLPALP